jgi:hypothetical protein
VTRAFRKAAEILALSAALYRELAISALRLIPGRGESVWASLGYASLRASRLSESARLPASS